MKASQTDGAYIKCAEMTNSHNLYISTYEGKRLIGILVVYMKNNINPLALEMDI